MSFSLDDLTTPPTLDEARTSVYNVLAILGVTTTDWRPGAVVRTIITAFCVLFVGAATLIASIARGGFLGTARGSWLTLLARYMYGVARTPATFATGYVTLSNAGGGVYTLAAGDLVVVNPSTGNTYTNTAGFTLGAVSVATVAVQCQQLGALGTSEAHAINKLQSPSLMVAAVSCDNAAAVVGQDEEGDELLRTRCSDKLGALSPNGPPDAYAYFARSATRSDGSSIGITRVRPILRPSGSLDVYVGTAAGGVTGDRDNTATDLGAVHDLLQRKATPLDTTEFTYSAAEQVIDLTYTVKMYNTSGLTEAQIKAYQVAALGALFSTQPIGGNRTDGAGYLYKSAIAAAIARAPVPDGLLPVFSVDVTQPLLDVAVSESGLPVLGSVTANILQFAPEGI